MRLFVQIAISVALVTIGCTEVTQTVGPTTVETAGQPPDASKPAATIAPASPTSGSISLEPDSITLAVGDTVNVKVVVTDSQGVEVDSESITPSVADTAILRYTGTDARTVSFLGVKAGTTSVIISASGLQASLVATVTSN